MDEGRNEGNSYFDDSNAEEQNFRGERTCKGLRYQKFLAEQQRNFNSSTQPNKRRKISGTRRCVIYYRSRFIQKNIRI